MSLRDDTTFLAEVTAPGRGGISTLALLGPRAAEALAAAFRARADGLPSHGRLAYGHVASADGEVLDEVIARCVAADEFEIHCHGGPAAVAAVAARFVEFGLARVDWPDYLRRRAARRRESAIVLDSELLLPEVATLPAALLVLRQRNALLASAVAAVCRQLDRAAPTEAVRALDDLLAAWRRIGRRVAQPPRVAIVGPPNVGKSSLMNRLAGADRAIVTDVPGTTRDVVTETVRLAGLAVVLADTAGIREATGHVEALGIERARGEAAGAELVLALVDLSGPPGAEDDTLVAACSAAPRPLLRVGTKADLVVAGQDAVGAPGVDVRTSAVTGQGIDELAARMLDALGFAWPASGVAVPFTQRQADLLIAARQALEAGDARGARLALDRLAGPARCE